MHRPGVLHLARAAQERKLSDSQNRCLQEVIAMKPSRISCISNANVLEKVEHILATQLLNRLHLLDRVSHSREGHPLRTATSFLAPTNH